MRSNKPMRLTKNQEAVYYGLKRLFFSCKFEEILSEVLSCCDLSEEAIRKALKSLCRMDLVYITPLQNGTAYYTMRLRVHGKRKVCSVKK